MKQTYNPFVASFDDVTVEDLVVLRTVHEGWYIEYKEAVPNPSSIAKSVSAFANTHGGYLFYGIKEKSKVDNVAGDFPGITLGDLEPMRERIRQAIAAHCAPAPHFDLRILSGPCDAIGLLADHFIICIQVPWSARAPHVHKNGVIYRRVSDSSEPSPENDRHALGELFKRQDSLLSMYRSWYEADPEFSEREVGQPYLRLLIIPDPWRQRDPWLSLPTADIGRLFNPDGEPITLPFDSIYSTRDGIIARQTKGNSLESLTLTWALRRDLTSEILIPIPCLKDSPAHDIECDLAGYDQEARFLALLKNHKYESLWILDLNQLYLIFLGIFDTLERLLMALEWEHGLSATFKILNADRACPFLDLESVMSGYEKTGIPVALNFLSALREHHHPDSFLDFQKHDENGEVMAPETNAAILMLYVARRFGISLWEDNDEDNGMFDALRLAGDRSLMAQTLRNDKR